MDDNEIINDGRRIEAGEGGEGEDLMSKTHS